MISVVMPNGRPISEKKTMNTMPRMISGIISGSVEMYSMMPLPLSWTFDEPTAPSVPMTAAAHEDETPRMMLFRSDSKSARSRNSSSYHLSEKPSQTELILLSLNE